MLKLMYITNQPEIAKIADKNGVDRIFIDLEKIGKRERQGGMDTVQSESFYLRYCKGKTCSKTCRNYGSCKSTS